MEHLERLEKADTSEERQKLKSCYASFQTRRRKRKVEEGQDEKGAELARVTAELEELKAQLRQMIDFVGPFLN